MGQEKLKKKALRWLLSFALKLSNKNLIRAIKIAEFFLIREKDISEHARAIKKTFMTNHPAVVLVKGTFKRLSKNCKAKFIENFFLGAAILGNQKRIRLGKKLGSGLPWFFTLSPTAQCNLKCRGCYAGKYAKGKGLSFIEINRILSEAKSYGIQFIVISGGEPFIRKDILDIFAEHHDNYFLCYTNGTLINKTLAGKLAKLGNVAPAISVEGFGKETDRKRGKGVFQKIMLAMDELREAGVLFGFSATATKENSEILGSEEFIDLMIKKGCSFGWHFQYTPIGRHPDVRLMATPEQRFQLGENIKKWRSQKPIFLADFWNDGPWVGGCIAGARPGGYFHINSNGDVEPCVFLQFSTDNIKGKKLIDVIRSPFFRAFQKAQPYCKNKNLLCPCALIDHPEVLREIVKKYKAKPSYNGSQEMLRNKKITNFLDSYSKKIKKITDPVWEKQYAKKFKHWKEKEHNL